MRHLCTQEDTLDSYAYTKHSLSFASQTIKDSKNNIHLNTQFTTKGKEGWAVRVKGVPMNEDNDYRMNVMFYVSGVMTQEVSSDGKRVLIGRDADGKQFSLSVEKGMTVFGLHVAKEQEYRIKDHLMQR